MLPFDRSDPIRRTVPVVVVVVLVAGCSTAGPAATDTRPSEPTTERVPTTDRSGTDATDPATTGVPSSTTPTGVSPTTGWSSDDGGGITAELHPDPPDGATVVNLSDPRLADAELVRRAVRTAHRENGSVELRLNESQLTHTQAAVDDVPYPGTSAGRLIQYRGAVYEVLVWVLAGGSTGTGTPD